MILVCFIRTFVHSMQTLKNLEALINNFESNFSFIAVSETWTPKGKSEVKSKKLEGYQSYHGNRETEVHQLREVVISMLRRVLSSNQGKILILLIMIQIINSNLLGLKSLMVANQT